MNQTIKNYSIFNQSAKIAYLFVSFDKKLRKQENIQVIIGKISIKLKITLKSFEVSLTYRRFQLYKLAFQSTE